MVDFSSPYAQLQTGAPDPAKILGLVSTLNHLKDFQARQAVGEAYQQATDPQSGLTDTGKFMGLVKSNPNASLRAVEAGNTSAALTGQYISNASSQFGLNSTQTKFLADLAGSFIGKKGGATDRDLATARVIAARNGIPPALTEGILAGGPGDARTPQQHFQDLQDFAAGPGGRAVSTQTGITGTGETVTGTGGQAMRQATTPTPAHGPPGIVTSLPPGSEASAALMQSDLARAGNFGPEVFPMQQALTKLNALGPGATAPGSKGRQEFESYLYGLAPSLVPAGMADKIKNYAELEKYLVQSTQSRAAGLGAHTDMGLATTISGSPNVNVNDLAVGDVLKMNLAIRRMEHAQTLNNIGGGAVGYAANKARWATKQDPRAYAIDLLTPDQVAKLDKSLKGADRIKFNASLKAAIDSGVIVPPSSGNAAQ